MKPPVSWLNINQKTHKYRNICLLLLATMVWVVYHTPFAVADHYTQVFPLGWGFVSNSKLHFKVFLLTTYNTSKNANCFIIMQMQKQITNIHLLTHMLVHHIKSAKMSPQLLCTEAKWRNVMYHHNVKKPPKIPTQCFKNCFRFLIWFKDFSNVLVLLVDWRLGKSNLNCDYA